MAGNDKLLESVADAVSAMVIFSNEAGNNTAVLRNLKAGAEGVRFAVMKLIGQASETVMLWDKLGSLEMSKRMAECCDGLGEAVNGIVRACEEVQRDPHDNVAKAHLLDSGKDIMKQMVALLQFNDLYDVMVALRKISVIEGLLSSINDSKWAADDFASLIRGICETMEKRQEITTDIRVKQMLADSKVDLEKYGIGLATLVKKSWTDPNCKAKIPIILEPFTLRLGSSQKAIKLSAKSPFDLGLLDTQFKFHDDDLIDEIQVIASDFHASLLAVKKAVKAGDEFEMERAIRAIEKDLRAQIAAAEELANQTSDPYLRAQMLAKIKAAKTELGNLMNRLRSEGKQALTSGDLSTIEALLTDVGKIYQMVVEGSALNELMKASESLDALLDDFPPAVKAGDAIESRALLQDIGKEVKREFMMAQAVAEACEDEYKKDRVLKTAQNLHDLHGDLSGLTNKALAGEDSALDELEGVVKKMKDANNELNVVAASTTSEELVERGALINSALVDIQDLSRRTHSLPHQNSFYIHEKLASLYQNMTAQVDVATSWATKITDDPELSERVQGQARIFQKAANKLSVEAKTLLDGTDKESFEKKKRTFMEAVDKVIVSNNGLVSLVVESPDDQMEALQGKLVHDMRHLRDAIARRDFGEVAAALADLRKDSAELSYLASLMATDLDDPDLRDSLLNISNTLTSQMGNVLNVSKNAMKNPSNPAELDSFLSNIEGYISKIVDISGSVGPEEKMEKNAESMSKLNKRYVSDLEKGVFPTATTKLNEEKKKVQKQKQLARAVANRCDFSQELSSKIVEETLKLDDLIVQLEEVTLQVQQHPDDSKVNSKMKKTAETFRKQAVLTGKLARDVKTGRKEAEERQKEEARLAEEKRKIEAAEKEMQMAKAIPVGIKEIWSAARDIQDITVTLLPQVDNSPAGNLVQLADSLAKSMQELAAISRTGTKKDIIMCTRKIADMVSQIEKIIQGVTSNCRDPHLNQELISGGQVAKNFSVQLKIICSVKAGLILEEDTETAQSLILCARGLCKSVGELVNLSQIAKLKPKK